MNDAPNISVPKVGAFEVNNPCVSIIVPLYNNTDYVGACVDSLRAQTLADIEIIVVDDGSSDGGVAVVDALAQKDARIVVLRQENGGPAAARNAGLRVARGEFVGFVDADDWACASMYERLYEAAVATGAAGARCGRVREFGEFARVEALTDEERTASGAELYQRLFGAVDVVLMPVWNAVYRRSVLAGGDVWFDEDLRNLEDILFNAEFFALELPVALLTGSYYHHREVAGSQNAHQDLRSAERELCRQIELLEAQYPAASSTESKAAWRHYRRVLRAITVSNQLGLARLRRWLRRTTPSGGCRW